MMTNKDGQPVVFLLVGVKNSGSGSLTFPEDIDVGDYVCGSGNYGEPGHKSGYRRVFLDKDRAESVARELNRESLRDFYGDDEELLEIINDPEWDGDVYALDLECDDVTLWDVNELVVE